MVNVARPPREEASRYLTSEGESDTVPSRLMKQKATASDTLFDAREVASYGVMEAAHYLRIPRTTIRVWVLPTMWIGSVLPKTIEQDAGRGYCYAGRESNLKHVLRESIQRGLHFIRIQRGSWCGLHCAHRATTDLSWWLWSTEAMPVASPLL
jgi:hypothetical protein